MAEKKNLCVEVLRIPILPSSRRFWPRLSPTSSETSPPHELGLRTSAPQPLPGVNLVVGTTGFSEEQLKRMHDAIADGKVAALAVAAEVLQDYDVEIVEARGGKKKDAPSRVSGRPGSSEIRPGQR